MKNDRVGYTKVFIGLMGAVGHQSENSTVSREVVPHTDFPRFFLSSLSLKSSLFQPSCLEQHLLLYL